MKKKKELQLENERLIQAMLGLKEKKKQGFFSRFLTKKKQTIGDNLEVVSIKDNNQKIKDKNAVLLLDDALKQVSDEWYNYPSIKNKWSRFTQLRQKLAQAKSEFDAQKNKLYEEKIREKRQNFDVIKPKNIFDVRGYIRQFEYSRQMERAMLINMELSSGDHIQFIAYPKNGYFKHKENLYLVDDQSKYYVHSAKMYASDYHEELSVPLIRKIPLTEIKKAVSQTGITDIDMAINPSLLNDFTVSKIIEKVLMGGELEEYLRKLRMMIIIILMVVCIHAVLFAVKSGILNGLPFIG